MFTLAADAHTYKYVRAAVVVDGGTLYGKVEFPYRAGGARVNGLFLSPALPYSPPVFVS
jgi:hypothetical protein